MLQLNGTDNCAGLMVVECYTSDVYVFMLHNGDQSESPGVLVRTVEVYNG